MAIDSALTESLMFSPCLKKQLLKETYFTLAMLTGLSNTQLLKWLTLDLKSGRMPYHSLSWTLPASSLFSMMRSVSEKSILMVVRAPSRSRTMVSMGNAMVISTTLPLFSVRIGSLAHPGNPSSVRAGLHNLLKWSALKL